MIKNNYIYIEHIQTCVDKILLYTKGLSEDQFLQNDIVKDAVIRNFEIIGEATKQLSAEFRKKNDNIPWKDIAGMRDILIHDYIGVDIWAVWNTVKKYVPELKINIETILENK